MMDVKKFLLLLAVVVCGCSHETLPAYSKKNTTEDFEPIVKFMGYAPGMAFADVGAGSGAFTVMFTTLMNGSTVYIQDIDTTVLNNKTLDHMLDYYSSRSNMDLKKKNSYHVTIGDVEQTNLPDATFDLIYSNGTVHNFTAIDSIMQDLKKKLKMGGLIFFRDSFKGDHNEGEFCSDPKCGKRLLTIDEFKAVMGRNGFVLVKTAADMSGYPLFGFSAE